MIKKAIQVFLTALLFIPISVTAQTCSSTIKAVAPDSRYQNHGDGTVTDMQTGLMWKKCSEGQAGSDCSGGGAIIGDWQGALQIPQVLNSSGGYAGYSDWRLPNIKELASLIEEQCQTPAINAALFPGTVSSNYWTASPSATNSSATSFNLTWIIGLGSGFSGFTYRSLSNYVRLVRSIQ